MSRMWRVTAIKYAKLASTRGALLRDGAASDKPDAPLELAYYFWLLESNDMTVMVDSGFDPVVGRRRGRTLLVDPLHAIRDLGVSPQSVEALIVSHFHYDHVGNARALPSSRVLVPAHELEFWRSSADAPTHVTEHVEQRELDYLFDLEAAGGLEKYKGGDAVLPGVEAIELPGHTPGHCGFMVETFSGPLLLAVDAVHFHIELERGWPFWVYVDLTEVHRSYETVRNLLAASGARLIPGHDPDPVLGSEGGHGSLRTIRLA